MNDELVYLIWDKELAEIMLSALALLPARLLDPEELEAVALAKSDIRYRLNLLASGRSSQPVPPVRKPFYRGRNPRVVRGDLDERAGTSGPRRGAGDPGMPTPVDVSPPPSLGQIVRDGIALTDGAA